MRRDHAQAGFVLGLDFGTSSAKISALDLNGHLLGQEAEPYPTLTPHPGWQEQRPDDWLPAMAKAIRRLLARAELDGRDAVALALSTAAHIGVLLDEQSKPVRPALLWSDQRSAEEAGDLAARHGDAILAQGQNWPTTTWTLPHLVWIRRHDPAAWARMRRVALSKDYLTHQLTGRWATDPATAVSALLFDPAKGAWSDWLCELAALTPDMLPDILPIGSEIGLLTREASDRLGLGSAVRVFNGTLDSTSETFAAGAIDDTTSVLRLASAGGLHVLSRGARPEPKLISYPYPIAPFWLAQAGTNTCATAVNWAAQLFTGSGREVDFSAWDTGAAEAPAGSEGLLFHPYLAGERCPYWDSRLRASFTGLSLGHGKNHLARAVYEGTALSLRDAAAAFDGRGGQARELRLVGGGAKSRLWCEIVSAVFDRPALPMAEADSSIGAAMLALVGLGASHADVVAGRATALNRATPIKPDPRLRDVYAGLFPRYRMVQGHLAAIAADAPSAE